MNLGFRKLFKHSQIDYNNNIDSLEITNDTDIDERKVVVTITSNNEDVELNERNELFSENEKIVVVDDALKPTKDTKEEDIGDDEEDLSKLLEDMEIPDFNMSISDFDDGITSEEKASEEGSVDLRMREEVFSRWYRPTKSELKELEELAKRLGVTSSGIRLTSCQKTLHELIFGMHSIILKNGPVDFNNQNCDLILLTDGFIAAYQNANAYNPLGSRYDTCQLWSAVEFVKIFNFGILKIQMKSGESFEICSYLNREDSMSWLEAIEHILVLCTLHSSNAPTEIFGWQYQLIHKPAYTAAVTAEMKTLGNPTNLNELDGYNESSPLHYAIKREPCSVDVIDALLKAGADPNLPDGEGRSAMYYAQQNNLINVEEMLKSHGGEKSALIEIERKGELFGGVNEAKRNTARRREIERAIEDNKAADVATKAQSAQLQMNENLNALIDRGKKINAMGDAVQQLNDEARAYGQLASQLKDQAKQKKWYQF